MTDDTTTDERKALYRRRAEVKRLTKRRDELAAERDVKIKAGCSCMDRMRSLDRAQEVSQVGDDKVNDAEQPS